MLGLNLVPCMSSQCSQLPSHLSSPSYFSCYLGKTLDKKQFKERGAYFVHKFEGTVLMAGKGWMTVGTWGSY